MKKLFKFLFFVTVLTVVFLLGTIFGGDKWGIGKGIGLVDENGDVTKDSVSQFVDNTKENVIDGTEKVKDTINDKKEAINNTISTPTPTPHPYVSATEILITAGKDNYSFYSEPCDTIEELENKILEVNAVNKDVVYVVDFTIASDKTMNKLKEVIERQIKANGIKVRYTEEK